MCVDGSTYIKKSKKKNKNICQLSAVTCHLRGSLCPLLGDGFWWLTVPGLGGKAGVPRQLGRSWCTSLWWDRFVTTQAVIPWLGQDVAPASSGGWYSWWLTSPGTTRKRCGCTYGLTYPTCFCLWWYWPFRYFVSAADLDSARRYMTALLFLCLQKQQVRCAMTLHFVMLCVMGRI